MFFHISSMPRFEKQKKSALNKLKASVHSGDADAGILPLLEEINFKPNYYSTSSCAGRVSLLSELGGKGVDRFLGKWHRKISVADVINSLKSKRGSVWFRYESPILHVCARSLDDANKILFAARESGFKRSGIQSASEERLMLELCSTEKIDAPVMCDGLLLVSEDYLRFLVEEANRKHDVSMKKISRLLNEIKKL